MGNQILIPFRTKISLPSANKMECGFSECRNPKSDFCKQVNFSLFSGPVIGATVNSSLNSLSVDDINRDTAITVISVKKADFGIMYGAAMEIGLDKFQVVKFLIGGRGTYGFSDINNDEDMGSNQLNIVPENSTIKTFGGFIGFKFAINGLYEYRHTSD